MLNSKSALFISLLFATQLASAGGLIIDRHGRTNGQSLSA